VGFPVNLEYGCASYHAHLKEKSIQHNSRRITLSTGWTWATKKKPAQKSSGMPDTFCRACGAELKAVAVCISCGKAVLYGCPRCSTFSDTKVHIGCLNQLSVLQDS
jgi:hypothetical protein